MKIETQNIERISNEQAKTLKQLGFDNKLSRGGEYPYSLDGLKMICPFILTTGILNGKPFATTRSKPSFVKQEDPDLQEEYEAKLWKSHIEKHYVFAESEIEAAYTLIYNHVQNDIINPGLFCFKMNNWKAENIQEFAFTY